MLQLREYQERSLDALTEYLRLALSMGAKKAFVHQTERPYRTVASLPELPYVCLRLPTGGGKTLLACHALGLVAREFLQADRAVCLWLVPSNIIREQTLAALRDRQHPYRQAVESRFTGPVTVMNLAEALYVQRGTLLGETVILVATLPALRVQDTDGRKIYESSGTLQHHFDGLAAQLNDLLERDDDGVLSYSLANVLRLHGPVVIIDEAHNARTPLTFEVLTRFRPSCIVEFTATPETRHDPSNPDPERRRFASNVLHHVSAAELKQEDMIKLPIKLQTRLAWKEVVGDAVVTQRELEKVAREEEKQTGEHIRPIVLLQAQPHSKERETITVEVVKQCLMDDFRVPEEHIAIATGEKREIDDLDLFDRACPKRFIITVQALKEGWDCSFAYVLCSVAEIGTTRAVEQILGRILRLPHACKKRHVELNCAYAFAASPRFIEAANSLHDALVDNGFERMEARHFVTGEGESQRDMFPKGGLFESVTEVVPEAPDLSILPQQIKGRVAYQEASGTLSVIGEFTVQEEATLSSCFTTDEGKAAVHRLAERSRGLEPAPKSPAERGETFSVPGLAIRIEGQLQLFEESHFLDFQWDLTKADAALSEAEFSLAIGTGQRGEVDVTEDGKIEVHYAEALHGQLMLLAAESGWTPAALVNWLDRQIPHKDLTHTQVTVFIRRVVESMIEQRGAAIEQLARLKFRLRDAVAARIEGERRTLAKESFNRMLFPSSVWEICVDPSDPQVCFSYSANNYFPNWYYEPGYRFQKHFHSAVGNLKPEGEEFECAVFIDQMEAVEYWVRNIEKSRYAFSLPTSTDRFYPDFVAKLKDGRILVVESKGEVYWSNDDSKEKRWVGEQWAERSHGRCLFVMPKGPDWQAIDASVRA